LGKSANDTPVSLPASLVDVFHQQRCHFPSAEMSRLDTEKGPFASIIAVGFVARQ